MLVTPGSQLEEPLVERRLAPDVELRGRLVEHEHARTVLHGVQRARQRDPLPLPARQIDAAGVVRRQHRVPAARRATR